MTDQNFDLSCPVPSSEHLHILLAHGGGGRLMHQLLDNIITPAIANSLAESRHDATVLDFAGTRLAFTTDSFVVHPLFFKGGDIGKLAICGTVNDLAMAGARPRYLSLGLIIEEGFPIENLRRIMASIGEWARKAEVEVVTGDTKVVERGKGDGVYINTSGIGEVKHQLRILPQSVMAGDAVILSGDIGRHGIAIMAEREHLKFESEIASDCAPLHREVLALLDAGINVHCLRDLTRGGLASALVEIAQAAGLGIRIQESSIYVSREVRAACELLGLDPLHVANEGRFVAFVPGQAAARAVEVLRHVQPLLQPQVIGHVTADDPGFVTMTSVIGAERIVDMLSGEQLPRIC
jgi:hydrogenase expression/formation protein HypE